MLLFKVKMNMLAKMKYRKTLDIKKVYCCSCFFDKLYYIFNSKDLIEYETFEKDFVMIEGYFKEFITGTVVIVCDDILFLMFEEGKLYSSFHICSVFKESKLLYEFRLSQ